MRDRCRELAGFGQTGTEETTGDVLDSVCVCFDLGALRWTYGICLMRESEARKASYLRASFSGGVSAFARSLL